MLKIVVPGEEYFDEAESKFLTKGDIELRFEHSLLSLSKWESIWEKPFLTDKEKTDEEAMSYIRFMCLDEDVPDEVFDRMSNDNVLAINKYIEKKHTATWFVEDDKPKKTSETITSELIYYWMVAMNIPFECETWHLNRLMTLVKVYNIKNAPEKKMSRGEILSRNRKLNAERRKQLQTKG